MLNVCIPRVTAGPEVLNVCSPRVTAGPEVLKVCSYGVTVHVCGTSS